MFCVKIIICLSAKTSRRRVLDVGATYLIIKKHTKYDGMVHIWYECVYLLLDSSMYKYLHKNCNVASYDHLCLCLIMINTIIHQAFRFDLIFMTQNCSSCAYDRKK